MNKKFLSILALMSFLAFSFPGQGLAAGDFSDINDHWASEFISTLSAAGYISGYPDGTFRPDKTASQAEFITILISCMGITPSDTQSAYFNDTKNHWARGSINEAVSQGILVPSEYSNVLQPDSGLKRSQAAAMMVRALDRQPDDSATSFTDKDDVEKSMYRGYIKTAYDLNLLTGYPGGEFKPFEYVTRAQMCKLILNFMEVNGGSSVNQPGTGSTVSGRLTSIAIGDELYDYTSVPVFFNIDFSNVRVSSITATDDYITINSRYRFFLNSDINNPDIVINNNRYGISKLLASGDKLVAYTSCRKIDSFNHGSSKYYSDFVKLYLNSSYTEKYLSDMEIVDALKVKVDGTTYDLGYDKVTIELGNSFYDITKINLGSTETSISTSLTDPVIMRGLTLSDISAIFVDNTTLNLDKISKIEFVIDGERYSLSNVVIDASGNFTVRQKTFSPKDVIMVADQYSYEIDLLRIYKDKFIFYCTEGDTNYWVSLNDLFVDADKVKILKDNVAYDIDQVLVIERNLVRIKGKQYKVDSSFKCLYGDDVYDIDRIDYDTSLDCITVRGDKNTDGYWANQPSKYVFFKDNKKYQEGTDDASIYVNKKWLTLGEIMISDPAHFTYDGKSYDLIGARIRIDTEDFEIVDTAWRGQTRVLDIYMEEY